jgi:hypothetical protein
MPTNEILNKVFDALKPLMRPYAEKLVCQSDEPGNLYVDTGFTMKNKKPLFFGAVQTMKYYVSYHLMPVYVNPGLLEAVSEALLKHMQGKSCFNFREVDGALFSELAELTRSGYDYYVGEGYIQPWEAKGWRK